MADLPEMITLTIGDQTFEIVDAKAREDILKLALASEGTLSTAKEYTDTRFNAIMGEGASEALDTIGELSKAMEENKDLVEVINKAIKGKADDFSIELYNGTSGNPKPVRFMSVDYSTCGSDNGVAIKLSMVSGHGNGTAYAFLQDVIVKVGYNGNVEVDSFKYYGVAAGTYDGASRQYGDIFWVVDTSAKVVEFYALMGQYARLQMTPWKRVTYSTGGAITQHTSCTVYSSGEKVWANNSEIATLEDIDKIISDMAPAYTYGNEDLEPGVSPLATGQLHLVYE